MHKKNIVGIEDYAKLLLQINDLLNSSFTKIKKQYVGLPHCEINYFDKEKKDVSIEIRFEEKEITITCTFDSDDKCNCVFIFSDKAETNNELITYLVSTFNYDFINTMWITPDYCIRIKKILDSPDNDICFVFAAKTML